MPFSLVSHLIRLEDELMVDLDKCKLLVHYVTDKRK